jgi:Domain of unknown function (DUF6894)
MPRYHFHIIDGLEVVFDSVGATFPNNEAAYAEKVAKGFMHPQLERLRAKAVRATLFLVPIRHDARRKVSSD